MTDEPSKPYHTKESPPDFLDGSMTRTELIAVLEGIRFPRCGDGSVAVELDAHVRDYLLDLLRR